MAPDFGHGLSEFALKKGIQELNSEINFDMGGRLNIVHPNMNIWQAVHFKGKHVGAMDRGTHDGVIPEYAIYALEKTLNPITYTFEQKRGRQLRIGWRDTFEQLHKARIPGVTRDTLCAKFGVPVKVPAEARTIIAAAG